MTAHELAAMLLKLPDIPVSFWKYMGGEDELREVEDATISIDPQETIILHTYKQE